MLETGKWNPTESLLPLRGKCLFFENELLDPAQCKKKQGVIHTFPSLFTSNRKEHGLGYATYYINVLGPADERDLALYIPQIYSCYKVWINGKAVAETGVVGKTKEQSKPQWVTKIVEFENQFDTLSIVLQVANFHHAKAGVKENLYLGTSSNILNKNRISVVANLSETIILFLIGFLFLVVFTFSERKRVAFYFAMLCITWALRSVFSNQYLFSTYFPDTDWTLQLRIEYITLFLTVIWGALTVSNLFKSESHKISTYALVIFNILFTLFCLFTEPRTFTQWLTLYLSVGVMLILYAGVVIIRAWINDRVGSAILAVSIFIGILIFSYDILVFEVFARYNPIIFSLGYITIFASVALALALHINLIRSSTANTTRLTYDDLFKKE
jgi:hypothetical protein